MNRTILVSPNLELKTGSIITRARYTEQRPRTQRFARPGVKWQCGYSSSQARLPSILGIRLPSLPLQATCMNRWVKGGCIVQRGRLKVQAQLLANPSAATFTAITIHQGMPTGATQTE